MTRDDERMREPDAEIDARLSALLDGELDERASAEIRSALAADPALAERFAALGEVDGQIQRIAAAEPDEARLGRLRRDLQHRLDAEASSPTREVQSEAAARRTGDSRVHRVGSASRRRRSRTRVWAPLAAALAAGFVLYLWGTTSRTGSGIDAPREPAPILVDRSTPEPTPSAIPAPNPAYPARDLATDESGRGRSLMPERDLQAPDRLAARPPASSPDASEAGRSDSPAPVVLVERSPLSSDAGEAIDASSQDRVLASLEDEELAVALQYDVLADLDTIENLELLELLALLDETESL
jgi:hypothetical protein